MQSQSFIKHKSGTILLMILLLTGLYFVSTYSYLLFHSLAELFSIVVAFGIFTIAPNICRLFTPNHTKSPREGTGLGLYVCHTLAERIEGRIEIENEPGTGSIFRLILPLQDQD